MNFSFLLKYLLQYLENHPDVVMNLFDAGAQALIAELKAAKKAVDQAHA